MREYRNRAILIIDMGTSKVRGVLIDCENGNVLGKRVVEYETLESHGELDAEQLFRCNEKVFGEIYEESCKKDIFIEAMSFSWFGANLVAMDKDGNPTRPLIVSYDERAGLQGEKIRGQVSEASSRKVVRGGLNGASIPAKILWIKENEPEVYEKTYFFGSIEQYILGKMGFPEIWDKTMAATCQYYDIKNDVWMRDVAAACGLPETMGTTYESTAVIGKIFSFGNMKIDYPIPVVPGGHDCVVAQLGQGVKPYGNKICADMAGTYDLMGFFRQGFVDITAADCITAPFENNYCVMAGGPSGEALSRLAQRLFGKNVDIGELFERSEFNGNRRFKLSETDPDKVSIPETEEEKIETFAIFVEAITRNLAITFKELQKIHGEPFKCMRIGGGASQSDKWLQLKADMFNIPVERSNNPESSCIGAAIIAGVAVGLYESVDDAMEKLCTGGDIFYPDETVSKKYENI